MPLYEEVKCPTCKGSGIVGNYYRSTCEMCKGSGTIYERTVARVGELTTVEKASLASVVPAKEYVTDKELARLAFYKWLVEQGRLVGDTKPYREEVA